MPISSRIQSVTPTGAPTLSEIARLVGDADPWKPAAILATGASFAEIERALLFARGEEEVLGEGPHPLEGRTRQVYEILTADAPSEDEARA